MDVNCIFLLCIVLNIHNYIYIYNIYILYIYIYPILSLYISLSIIIQFSIVHNVINIEVFLNKSL